MAVCKWPMPIERPHRYGCVGMLRANSSARGDPTTPMSGGYWRGDGRRGFVRLAAVDRLDGGV